MATFAPRLGDNRQEKAPDLIVRVWKLVLPPIVLGGAIVTRMGQ
jgi:hypothetical protein